MQALQQILDKKEVVKGKVIGWNKGGFHVVAEGVTAFCPNSEMELGKVRAPKDYLDNTYEFLVLRIEDSGRRVVLSRSKFLHGIRNERRAQARQKVTAGAEITGKVASLTNFGAFVDLGGVQGLVHVSEISRNRVEDPAKVLSVGQQVKVKVLKVEQGGKRVSLSMKALEPDPWKSVTERFSEGSVVQGTVERTASFGAFVMLEPGLTGLLPASAMNLPRDASINRMYSPGKQLPVLVMSIDPRRRRISLALEGSQTEGSRSDFENYKKSLSRRRFQRRRLQRPGRRFPEDRALGHSSAPPRALDRAEALSASPRSTYPTVKTSRRSQPVSCAFGAVESMALPSNLR